MKIANAPCSWGVLEFDLEGQAAGYAQVLDEIADSLVTSRQAEGLINLLSELSVLVQARLTRR